MQSAKIMSLNVGTPAPLVHGKKEVMSGIVKRPVTEPVWLSMTNLQGDEQADLVHHGGVDKAVCVYPYEHYAYWERELNRTLEFGAFGENLTTQGAAEQDISIGDIFRIGEAVVQVSQPRQPCFKLSAKYGVPELPVMVQDTGYTGYYFRVLQEGAVRSGDELILVNKHPGSITVSFANQIMHHDKKNEEAIREILNVDALSGSWRETLMKRLGGISIDTQERLTGQKGD
ncbi:MOSC domain-containing protein [Paenibacillus tarimensis]